jgi:dipeptidyl aminopeptidase/acylaminoacyl peptidase
MVYVHGGPWGQIFDNWAGDTDLLHYFSQSGFAVFVPNYRGSTGYGAAFKKMDIGEVQNRKLNALNLHFFSLR